MKPKTTASVTSITPPSMSRDTIDASHEQSPGAWREFIGGLKDAGEVKLELNFVAAGAAATALAAEMDLVVGSETKTRRIVFTDGAYFEFEGFLTGWEPDAPIDDKMTASATFKVTGKPTLVQS